MMEATIAGEKGEFECPISICIYGTCMPAARVDLERRLKADKILKATELKRTKKEALEAEAKRGAMGLKGGRSTGDSAPEPAPRPEISMLDLVRASQNVNFRMDGDAIKALAVSEDDLARMPEAEQPRLLKSQLLPYQLQVNSSHLTNLRFAIIVISTF